MGLDQYAFSISKDDERKELAYWRKHNRLQGWMHELFEDNGGEGDFNCVDVELTSSDIESLEVVVNNKMLPETGGFFFGGDSYSDYEGEHGYKKDDLKFIEVARQELKKGNRVFYNCWY